MPRALPPFVAASIALLAAALLLAPPATSDDGDESAAEDAAGPVVLELYTSQGCSSCPPADRLLTRLSEDPEWRQRVVPLSFHVDYWNYIGWTDPFSSERWSDRQRCYAAAFDSERIYTPQLVIDGSADCVGSQQRCVERAIERAEQARRRGATPRLTMTARRDGEAVAVEVIAERAEAGGGPLAVMVALTETDLTTPVARGENARRTLHNDNVVRRLEEAGRLAASATGEQRFELRLPVEEGWSWGELRVAAFLQRPAVRGSGGRPIVASAAAPVR